MRAVPFERHETVRVGIVGTGLRGRSVLNEFLGIAMLVVMLGAIFIGLPISFTLLFLAIIFGLVGLGSTVFDLAYLQTIGLMKQDEFVAVPMFILKGYICDQAEAGDRMAVPLSPELEVPQTRSLEEGDQPPAPDDEVKGAK